MSPYWWSSSNKRRNEYEDSGNPFLLSTISHLSALAFLLVVAKAMHPPILSRHALIWSLLACIAGGLGLAVYQSGRMGLASPVVAVLSVGIPAVCHNSPRGFAVEEPSRASSRLCVCGRSQGDGSLGGEQEESERLLQIQADGGIGMAEITDGDVLSDVKVEIAATSRQHESASDGGRPYDLIVDQPLDVLQDRVSVISGLGECGVSVGTEQHRVGAVDADETQLA